LIAFGGCIVEFEFDLSLFSLFGGAIAGRPAITHSKRERQIKSIQLSAANNPKSFTSFNFFVCLGAAMPFFSFFISSARPLGRTSWNEIKREDWAAAYNAHFTMFNFMNLSLFIHSISFTKEKFNY